MTTTTVDTELSAGPALLEEDPAERAAYEAAAELGPDIRPMWEQVLLYLFVLGPFAALIAGVIGAAAFGIGPSLVDIIIAAAFYVVAGHGITMGYHRYFTHGSFKATRGMKIALGISGSLALQGPMIRWVADHRKHHAFSDKDGDPHSPWRFGTGPKALVKGLYWAHTGWLFDREQTNKDRFAPDLMADKDLVRIHKYFPIFTLVTFAGPMLLGGLITMSWTGAFSALFWAGLVRVTLLHHVTWSINSVCHVFGERPFTSRDKATNVWWLCLPSMGESWHNLHHSDPTCARHGVDKFQLDTTARVIAVAEKFGWVSDVRWPKAERLDRRRVAAN